MCVVCWGLREEKHLPAKLSQTDKCRWDKTLTGAGKGRSVKALHHEQIVGYAPDSDFGKGQKLGIVHGERTFMGLFTTLLIH